MKSLRPNQTRRNASLLAAASGLLVAAVGTAAFAGDVYQWKDAKGVTQYSSSPPPKGNFKVRAINHSGAASTAAAVTDAKPVEDPQCSAARKNVQVLQSESGVQLDSNGDGKADRTLSDSERANQLALAQALLTANCAGATASAK